MKKIQTVLFSITLLCSFITSASGNWIEYFKEKIKDPPREFVKVALAEISNDLVHRKIAFDLGSGVGNETILLLDSGYQVVAIDNQVNAIEILKNRPAIKRHLNNLIAKTESFENLDFNALPHANVVVASASIPFCNPKYFNKFWHNLVEKIEPGGYFIGHTFDPRTTAFTDQEKSTVTFHNKEQTLALFKQFDILSIKALIQNTKDENKYFYCYEIVAKKKI